MKTTIQRLVILCFVIVSLFSCSKPTPTNELQTINVLEAEEGELNISEIADEISYIPLANDSILAYIKKVVFSNGEYFITDNKSSFLRFDANGNLLNQIGRQGRGPQEYSYVSDFIIHPESGNIYVTGGKEYKIMVYSPEGQFLKPVPISMRSAASFGFSNGNLFLFYFDGAEHNEISMELVDTDGNSIKSYPNNYEFERGRAMMFFTGECLMYSLEGKLHFKEIFSDTIFYLDGQEIVPETILNSGDKRFSPEKRTKTIKELSADPRSTSESMKNSVIQTNLFETDRYLFYGYGEMLIYDKKTGVNVETGRGEGIINDWDGGPNIQLKMNKDDNTVFSWINAFELKTYVESEAFKNSTPKYPEKKKQLEQLANSLDENDNPVLMLVKLKE